MSKNRIIYNVLGLFAGPCPASGNQSINYTGGLNDAYLFSDPEKTLENYRGEGFSTDYYINKNLPVASPLLTNDTILFDPNENNALRNYNLLFQLDRIQGCSYSFEHSPNNVVELGRRGTLKRPSVNNPTVNFSFNYLINGIKNELRLGFNVNYPRYTYEFSGNESPIEKVSLLKYLIARDDGTESGTFWPYNYRDCKNYYVAISDSADDLKINGVEDFTEVFNQNLVNNRELDVVSFGNMYITSYSVSAAINSLPVATVSILGDNIGFNISGSGFDSPALNPRTREPFSGKTATIPPLTEEGGISALNPGDIVLEFYNNSGDNLIEDVGPDFNGRSAIYSMNINLSLTREPLASIGYKLPLDRQINFPVFAQVNFSATIADFISGSVEDLVNSEKEYNFAIELKRNNCVSIDIPTGFRQAGLITGDSEVYVRYDILKARCVGFSYENQIGSNLVGNFSFETELDPDDLSKGLFISGLHGIEKLENFWLYEHPSGEVSGDGYYLPFDDESLIVIDNPVLF